MQIDDATANLIRAMFDSDGVSAELAKIDLYLGVLPANEHIAFLDGQLNLWLATQTTISVANATAEWTVKNNIEGIVRGLVARRRVRLNARDKLRRWGAA